MSDDDWSLEEPTLLEKLKLLLNPPKKSKKSKKNKIKVEQVEPTAPLAEPKPKVVVDDSDDEWVQEKPKKKRKTKSFSLPGARSLKRAVATILFITYCYLELVVVKLDPIGATVCLTTLIIVFDYINLTRKEPDEKWDE